MKEFAPEYPRNQDGFILFPSDVDYRKFLFPFLKLSEHPAKANIYLVQSIVEYVSEPYQGVMDIMAGTGTIMVAALVGRKVICVELEDEYVKILEQAAQSLERIAPGVSEVITVIPGDCSKLLPLPIADHIIFSPPYASIMKKKKLVSPLDFQVGEGLLKYSKHPDNIGNLNEFLYHQKMEIIYKAALESLPAGGTLSIIIKDHIIGGKRVFLGERAKRDCVRAGFNFINQFKWLPPGSAFLSLRKARGEVIVDDEDIIILGKPL